MARNWLTFIDRFQSVSSRTRSLLEEVVKGSVTLLVGRIGPLGLFHLNEFMGHVEIGEEAHADAAAGQAMAAPSEVASANSAGRKMGSPSTLRLCSGQTLARICRQSALRAPPPMSRVA